MTELELTHEQKMAISLTAVEVLKVLPGDRLIAFFSIAMAFAHQITDLNKEQAELVMRAMVSNALELREQLASQRARQ